MGDIQHAIERLLPAAKARTALRLLCAGRPLARDAFDSNRALTNVEWKRLDEWQRGERGGLATSVAQRHVSSDGSVRLVVQLADGQTVETVAMAVRAVCVSTQVGCAVGCRFCASGMLGLARNLTRDEIVEQLVHARRVMPIDRVVYMGMGEPSHNLANVLDAVAFVKEHGWIGPGKQTFSTIGSVKAFETMAKAAVKPCLALSLHAADDAKRRELVPNAGPDALRDVVAAAAAYAKVQKKPIVFEWTLLAGVNDSDGDADALCDLLQSSCVARGARGYVNFIRWNPVEGMNFTPTSFDRAIELRERVKSRGLLATIRASTGDDVDGACGQLRRRTIEAR
jgi:23S rRNA (adenine2503-C2)-methyltransferase